MTERLRLIDVTIKYGDFTAIDKISFSVNSGDVVFITGANGSGKSTLLKGIAGLIKLSSGEIKRTEKMSYVPQFENADRDFPAKVREIILMGTQRPGSIFYTKEKKLLALNSMTRLKISDLAEREIKTLSGGQMRRVFLARALCGEPELLLLDEPCAGLDYESHEFFYEILREIRKKGTSIIIVTHDAGDLEEIKDSMIMEISDGSIKN